MQAARASEPMTYQAGFRGEIAGGLASSIPAFVYALTLGLVVYAPLGAQHAELGIRAGFAAAVFGGAVSALASGTPLSSSGPRASVALVLAGFVLKLTHDPALGVEHISALAALCVLCAGVMQLIFGLLRVGTLARFSPHPVVAGFLCGIAVLIVLSQLPALGLGQSDDLRLLPLAIGVATAGAIWAIGKHKPRWPGLLIGLLIGIIVHSALALVFGPAAAGPLVGELPAPVLLPSGLASPLQRLADVALRPHAVSLLTASMVIAIIGSLDTLLAAVAIDAVAGTRHRANRELLAQGLGNVASGLLGGIPIALSAGRAVAAYRAGGRTPAVGWIAAGFIAAVAYTSVPFLERLPLAVLAGVMLTIAWSLIDEWTRGLVRRLASGSRDAELLRSAAVVLVVAAITVFVNFIVAVIAGVFLSIGLFIDAMNRSLVRAVYSGNIRPSRRIYGPELTARLDEARRHIRVVELEGALFFGSTEQLADTLDELWRSARHVVLDLSRLSAIDVTGALALERVARRAAAAGSSLLLAGPTRQRARLLAAGALPHLQSAPWFIDADHAIEHAERSLLGPMQREHEIALERLALAEGLDADEMAVLSRALTRIEMRAGDVLFQEGEAGDLLYVLARGAVAIVIAASADGERRLVTFAPGAIFGEAAMLDRRARSATATAIEDAVLYSLSRETLDAMAVTSPRTALKLLANLGRQLSSHLRHTTNTLRDAWGLRR
jgi:MFS superfamily sulfate permease-like transporter/CRP-like cAMP-binding protein